MQAAERMIDGAGAALGPRTEVQGYKMIDAIVSSQSAEDPFTRYKRV
jgi:hypothetical protein